MHPQATDKDVTAVFQVHGTVLSIERSVAQDDHGNQQAVGVVAMASLAEARVCVARATVTGLLAASVAGSTKCMHCT